MSAPVFDPADIPALLQVVEQLSEATRVIAKAAIRVEDALRTAKQNLQRAQVIASPPYREPVSTRALTKGAIGEGALKILRTLQFTFPQPMQKFQLERLCNFSPSTMRTYVPILRRGEYLHEDARGIALTPRGLEFLTSRTASPA